MKIDEEKLKDKIADILLGGIKNKTVDRIIDAVYEATSKQRTSAQNRALHKDCEIIAEKLNDAGYTVQNTIKIDIPFTTVWVKEFMWKPIMKKMTKLKSTTDLEKNGLDINEIHKVLMNELGEKLQIEYHPFPSEENLSPHSL